MPKLTNKIEQRGPNSFRAQVMINGKSESITEKTKGEVQRKINDLKANAAKGILPPREKLRLGEFVQGWLEDSVRHSLTLRTYQEYGRILRLYVLPTLGKTLLEKLQPSHLQKLYSDLLDHGGQQGKGLSPKTVRDTHVVLHQALDQAVRQGLANRNVADLIDPPKVPRAQVKAFSQDEQTALLEAAKGTRWETLLKLGLVTGMRIGEMLGLQWSNVDLVTDVVRVERKLNRDRTLGPPKTDAGKRPISIGKQTVEMLQRHRVEQLKQKLAAGPNWEQRREYRDLVFTNQQGGPLDYNNVMRGYYALLEKAGLEKSGIHRLRHTNASIWLKEGIHPKKVQSRLGHSSIGMTMDTYSHLMPGFDREDADRLEAKLG